MRVISSIALLCLLVSAASAATYYVAIGGTTSGAGCGAQATPCGSLLDAFNVASFGDNISIADGTYNGNTANCQNRNNNNAYCNGFFTTNNGNLPQNVGAGSLFIFAQNPGRVTFDLTGTNQNTLRRFMDLTDVSGVTFIGIRWINGRQNGDGGSFQLVRCEFTFIDCVFENSVAGRQNNNAARGGALRLQDSQVIFNRCSFINNQAATGGGAVFLHGVSNGDNSIFTDCTFTNNRISQGTNNAVLFDGGALQFDGSPRTVLERVNFTGNSARRGGAVSALPTIAFGSDIKFDTCFFGSNIAVESGGGCDFYSINSLLINNSTFTKNVAETGGGIFNRLFNFALNPIYIKTTSFSDNIANGPTDAGVGGAIASTQDVDVRESQFTNNKATHNGGAIHSLGDISLSDCIFTSNSVDAPYSGGAVYAGYSANPTKVFTSIFRNNSAGSGGAFGTEAIDVTIRSSLFQDNTATDVGGAVNLFSGQNTIFNCQFDRNTAQIGGGVYSGTDVIVTGCRFNNNAASIKAGGLACETPLAAGTFLKVLSLSDSIFNSNTAGSNGGGAWATCNTDSLRNSYLGNKANGGSGGAFWCGQQATYLDLSSSYTNNSASVNGGAINGNCTYTLTSGTFTSNTATVGGGALISPNPVTVTSVIFRKNAANGGNGGAIQAQNGLTVASSTFTENTAIGYVGGAVWANSFTLVTVTDSNFDSNSANVAGGAYVATSEVEITNSNFLNNMAVSGDAGGFYSNSTSSTLTTVEFSANSATGHGAGLFINGESVIKTSTFTANTATLNGGGLACVSSSSPLTVTQCTFDSNIATGDGGAVYSMCIPTLSKNAYTSNFANGSIGGGAVYSTATTKESSSTYFQNQAKVNGGAFISTGSATFTSVSFDTNSAGVDGGAIFTSSSVTMTLTGFKKNSATTGNGGAVSSSGTLSMTNSNFTSNTAALNGGAILTSSATDVPISATSFDANNAGLNGGAIYSTAASMTIESSFFNRNAASNGDAGAIHATSQLTVTQTSFDRNTASGDGGAVFLNMNATVDSAINSTVNSTFESSPFTFNTARNGGAIACATDASLFVSNSQFTSNAANLNGGALWSMCATTLETNAFTSNSAKADGGALHCSIGSVTVSTSDVNSVFTTNSANGNGGALFGADGCDLKLSEAEFDQNTARVHGGAAAFATGSSVTIDSTSFSKNAAGGSGGAVSSGGLLNVVNATSFSQNTAGIYAGGVFAASNGQVTVTGASFSGNDAPLGGSIGSESTGGLSSLTVTGSSFTANSVFYEEGGMIAELDGTVSFADNVWANPASLAKGYAFRTNSSTVTFTTDVSFPNISVNGGSVVVPAGVTFRATSHVNLVSGGLSGAGSFLLQGSSKLNWASGDISVATFTADAFTTIIGERVVNTRKISTAGFTSKGLIQLALKEANAEPDTIEVCLEGVNAKIANNGTLVLGDNCTIKGTGSIVSAGRIWFAKNITIDLDVTFTSTSTVHFSLYDDSNSDRVTAKGAVTLGGTLSGDAVDGYKPNTDAARQNKTPAKWLLLAGAGAKKNEFSTQFIHVGDLSTDAAKIIAADSQDGELLGSTVKIEGSNVYLEASALRITSTIGLLIFVVISIVF